MTVPTAIPECTPDLLRTLFLFESLSDERLEYLCQHGQVVRVEPGWLYREGDDATCFYVLLNGSLVMSRKVVDDEVGRPPEGQFVARGQDAFVAGELHDEVVARRERRVGSTVSHRRSEPPGPG